MDGYSPGVQQCIEQGRHIMEGEQQQRAVMRGKRFDTIAVHGLYDKHGAFANQGSIIESAFLSTAQHFALRTLRSPAGLGPSADDLARHRPDRVRPHGRDSNGIGHSPGVEPRRSPRPQSGRRGVTRHMQPMHGENWASRPCPLPQRPQACIPAARRE